MRLLICAGGTGGGVYPALAVLAELAGDRRLGEPAAGSAGAATAENLEVLWVGGEGGMEEELVKQAGVTYESIPAAGVHGVGLRAMPRNLLQLGRGFRRSRRILRQFHPDAIFFTGGYIAVPLALASRAPGLGITPARNVLYVPDIEPGLALKALARFSDTITVTDEASRSYFPSHSHVVVSGYPTRPELGSWSREQARSSLSLDHELPVVLVTGGSKGARSINRALLAALPTLLRMAQVVHISGKLDWLEVQAARAELTSAMGGELAAHYHAFPYLHKEMGAALAAADLVVSRAGASSLGEYPLFGLPAVLVPYPYAWRYQMVNAQYLAQHGAALVLDDASLQAQLLPVVSDLLRNPTRLEQMGASMRTLARPEAARVIARQLDPQAGRGAA